MHSGHVCSFFLSRAAEYAIGSVKGHQVSSSNKSIKQWCSECFVQTFKTISHMHGTQTMYTTFLHHTHCRDRLK